MKNFNINVNCYNNLLNSTILLKKNPEHSSTVIVQMTIVLIILFTCRTRIRMQTRTRIPVQYYAEIYRK